MAKELPKGFVLDQAQQKSQLPQGFNLDVPTPENLAADEARVAARVQPSFADTAIGLGEAALATATGATGGAVGFISGAAEGAVKELTGQIPRGGMEDLIQQRSSALTFAPRTEEGQGFVKGLGDILGAFPPILGTTPLNTLRPLVAGSLITEQLLKNPRAKRVLLANEIRKGNPNIELVTKALDASGEIITRPASKRALKILGGDDVAKGTVSVLENMSPASKAQVRKQLRNIERGRIEPLFGDANRPSDILGESILNRAVKISDINKKAGQTIGKTAKELSNINVDISQPSTQFFNQLNDLGVTFSRGEDGYVTPDFSRSKFIGGSQKDMTVLVNDLINQAPDFETAHKLKRTIRDNIDFDTGGTAQIKGDSQKILKDLSSGIDSILDETSPKYKKANESFAKTIKVKQDFDKLAGKDIDVSDDLSAEVFGGKAMRIDSNSTSRTAIKKLFIDTDNILAEFGIKFKDDIPSLIHITAKLNDSFKLAPGGSLKGNIISGALDVAEASSGPVAAARIASQKLTSLKDPDFNKKLRAFRSLVTEQEQK
jgi:hypothetical protein